MEIKKIGVVGCGLMGSGIAQVSIQSGYQTIVREISDELMTKGLDRIKGSLSRAVERGRVTAEGMEKALSLLTGTTKLDDFKDCDLVIEAVFENMEEKKKVFAALDGACRADAILATNTSTLSPTEISSAAKKPELIVGMHFFSPVPAMRLVEIVRGLSTNDETVNTAKAYIESLGKVPVITKDSPGFIVNRLLIPYMIDAARIYEQGLASAEDIDNAMKLGCNHPMGPLELADFTGLDIAYNASMVLYNEYGDARFCPPPILRRMVAAGQLGRKTGKGFYNYK